MTVIILCRNYVYWVITIRKGNVFELVANGLSVTVSENKNMLNWWKWQCWQNVCDYWFLLIIEWFGVNKIVGILLTSWSDNVLFLWLCLLAEGTRFISYFLHPAPCQRIPDWFHISFTLPPGRGYVLDCPMSEATIFISPYPLITVSCPQ